MLHGQRAVLKGGVPVGHGRVAGVARIGEEREVGLFAVRRETIEDFLVDFQAENMTVEMLTLGYLGSLNFILHDVRPEAPAVVEK